MGLDLRGRNARLFWKAAPPQMASDFLRIHRLKPFHERYQLAVAIVDLNILSFRLGQDARLFFGQLNALHMAPPLLSPLYLLRLIMVNTDAGGSVTAFGA